MSPKIKRNLDTSESQAFWAHVEACAKEVATWPAWKRVGVSEPPQLRRTPRILETKSEPKKNPQILDLFERLLKE